MMLAAMPFTHSKCGCPQRVLCRTVLAWIALFACAEATFADDAAPPLPGTKPLAFEGDLSAHLRAGLDQHLSRLTEQSVAGRAQFWNRDFSSAEAYDKSVEPNRQRLRQMLGVVDPRVAWKDLELVGTLSNPALLFDSDAYAVYAVRWPVLEGVHGEGVLLRAKRQGGCVARVVALPDAEQTPEMLAGLAAGIAPASQFARKLAEAGCDVVVPVLIDRRAEWSGSDGVWYTNQPHREWIYRLAFTFGRHVIGYEVQKVLAIVDGWLPERRESVTGAPPVVVAGYGEGGLLALYAAACDERISGAFVSGYFGPRENLHDEPIYRNVFGLLREFGDAELATLVYPRPLVIEHSAAPAIAGPPAATEGRRAVAAPGGIATPATDTVVAEVNRVRKLLEASRLAARPPELVTDGVKPVEQFGSSAGLERVFALLGVDLPKLRDEIPQRVLPGDDARLPDAAARQRRQVRELVEHTQLLLRRSPQARAAFWSKARPTSPEAWANDVAPYREYFHEEIVGRFPPPSVPVNARTRRIFRRSKFECYEVLLDVYDDVMTWGYLAVPNDIPRGEKRPVVVCQHGLEGLPADVFDEDPRSAGYQTYRAYATRLAELGYVVYAPHNFYCGGNAFRQLQRKAHPLKKALFGIAVAQHLRLTEWLAGLPFVDGERMAFYGLSYGGSSASRLPPLVPRYRVVINSANFNEGINKAANVEFSYSYVYHGTYEWFEWNAGHTFSDGDLAALVAPRAYMVERGHFDGVAPDEWVAGEYARVRRLYAQLGIPEKTAIEFFPGGHVINAQGTFHFLRQHLRWPRAAP